ncbi:hypothetical protein [Planctomycetes bacterium K23_9]|uniref:hypothetical protein n=1 Tax=Stieleria marina TaxID=1930275 RepID=UPI00119D060F
MASHRLGELPLAHDQRLCDLLSEHPRDLTQVYSTGSELSHPNELRVGELGDCRSDQILEAVRRGRLCIVLRDVDKHQNDFRHLLGRLYSELNECDSSLRASDIAGDLVLASPNALQYFNCDPCPTIRWQLRGSQSISLYPVDNHFIDPQTRQAIAVEGQCSELFGASYQGTAPQGVGLYFEADFLKDAQTYFVDAGNLISIPHLIPRHTQYHGDLCVWFQTRANTPQSLRYRNIASANCFISKAYPRIARHDSQKGILAATKNLLGSILSLTDRRTEPVHQLPASFSISPVKDLAPTKTLSQRSSKKTQPSPVVGFLSPTQSISITPVVSEQ